MRQRPGHVLVVGAGASGLVAGRELARSGRKVTILEARKRLGGRVLPLPAADFGYAAEGGAEFIHGEAPLTRGLVREAGLSLMPTGGQRWRAGNGAFTTRESPTAHNRRLRQALNGLKIDLPIAEFLQTQFPGRQFAELRREITRMVEGYDAADPTRASTLALRDEWLGGGLGQSDRIVGGYGALIGFLASDCQKHGATIHLGAAVAAIETDGGRIVARCRGGAAFVADTCILTMPLPVLADIALPPEAADKLAAHAADIGFGNVVKILLRFRDKWWTDHRGHDLSDMSFLISDARVPTWWTQYPSADAVLTGWYAGPKADTVTSLAEAALVEMGLGSLADVFEMPIDRLRREVLAARAINWGADPLARCAYSYATPATRAAQAILKQPDGGGVLFSGEALHAGPDIGTVEAALASGLETARIVLAGT